MEQQTTETAPQGAVPLDCKVRFPIGKEVTARVRIWEPATGDSPGGLLTRPGEKLIVRAVKEGREFPIEVSHEHVTDGRTFGVKPEELCDYSIPASIYDADLTHL